jgi:hypothetical protein
VLTVPAAAVARSSAPAKPGYLVVRKAAGDGGVNGQPVVTLVVRGFVLGRVSQEARVAVYYLPSKNAGGTPQVQQGADVSTSARRWNGLPGRVFRGTNFRFRAMGGFYRVVVRLRGVSSPAATAMSRRGSSVNPRADGWYSVDARSAPCRIHPWAEDRRVRHQTSRRFSSSRTSRRLPVRRRLPTQDGFTLQMTASGREVGHRRRRRSPLSSST